MTARNPGTSGQPGREGLEYGAVGLAEAQRVEMVHGLRPVDLEQEAAGVAAVATAGRGLLDDRHRRAGVVGGDRRRRSRRAEADDEDVDRGRKLICGGPVMIRSGSEPSQPWAAARTIA